MFGFKDRGSGHIEPEFIAPPAEVAARVADIDRKLTAIKHVPRAHRTPAVRRRIDDLLDERLMLHPLPPLGLVWPPLRPSVPVIPGRSS